MMGTILLYLLTIGFSTYNVQASQSVCGESGWYTTECIQFLERTLLTLQNQVNALSVQLSTQSNLIAVQTSQLTRQSTQLTAASAEVEGLKANPVPIGFIYVQLSNQQSPESIWSTVMWQDITNTYAGLFFRALGGGSSAFGATQSENSPRITDVHTMTRLDHVYGVNISSNNELSAGVSTGAHPPVPRNHWALRFRQSTGEIRPRNQAVRIWKRIG